MIFVSYAREDEERARRIHQLLNKLGQRVFLDKEDLHIGADWRFEIETAIERATFIVVICSANSVSKDGFVQKELRLSLERAELVPEGGIVIVPIRFDQVEVPRSLRKFNWIEINGEIDYHVAEYFFRNLISTNKEDRHTSLKKENDLTGTYRPNEVVVVSLNGKNSQGIDLWSYVKLPVWKLYEMSKIVAAGGEFTPSDFGEVVASGVGAPPLELVAELAEKHSLIDVPRVDTRAEPLAQDEILEIRRAHAAVYKALYGRDVIVPDCEVPLQIRFWESPLEVGVAIALKQSGISANHPMAEPGALDS